MADFIEKEAPSEVEAVMAACFTLGIEREGAQIQVLSRTQAGRVKVRVGKPGVAMPEAGAPVAAAAPAAVAGEASAAVGSPSVYQKPAASVAARPAKEPPTSEQLERLQVDLARTLELMAMPAQIEVKERLGNVILNLTGPHEAMLIGRHGATLDSLQVLSLRMLSEYPQGRNRHVVIDVADYRGRLEEDLAKKARTAAEQVLADGGQATLGPLSAAERRVVHLELKTVAGLETFSVGDGARKKVVIQKKV